MEAGTDIKALFIIVNAGFADDVIDIAREAGARGATILNARGEGLSHEVFMGITVAAEKELVLSITDEETADKIMEAVKEKAGKQTPFHGVCFTLGVDKMVGLEVHPDS